MDYCALAVPTEPCLVRSQRLPEMWVIESPGGRLQPGDKRVEVDSFSPRERTLRQPAGLVGCECHGAGDRGRALGFGVGERPQ